MKLFRIIKKLLLWMLRIGFWIACTNHSEIFPEEIFGIDLMLFPIAEIIASGVSLSRFEPDQIISVVTGFIGDSDVGFYELNDNSGARLTGYIAFFMALVMRAVMLYAVAKAFGWFDNSAVADATTQLISMSASIL